MIKKPKEREKENLVVSIDTRYGDFSEEIQKYLDDGWIRDSITAQTVATGNSYTRIEGNFLCIFYRYKDVKKKKRR